jgi:hypothetical protein
MKLNMRFICTSKEHSSIRLPGVPAAASCHWDQSQKAKQEGCNQVSLGELRHGDSAAVRLGRIHYTGRRTTGDRRHMSIYMPVALAKQLAQYWLQALLMWRQAVGQSY